MYDYLVVGSGLFGSIFAYEMHKRGKKVIVLERRNHIGGNCFTQKIEGINVHMYGPHIFHTNSKKIWDYINQFATFNNYVHHGRVTYKDRVFSFPINLMTLHQLWGVKTPEEALCKLSSVREEGDNSFEGFVLSQVGREVYETFYKGYTTKQWGRSPAELPAWIAKRLPIRLTYDDRYFYDQYQGIPVGGYTQIFEKLLEGIEVKTSTDYEPTEAAKNIVYTGQIDEFFNYKHGELEYLSLDFQQEIVHSDFQGCAIMNYTDSSIPFTRITEHKHFEFGTQEKSVITREYPAVYRRGKVPYYPVNSPDCAAKYALYAEEAKQSNVIFGGRLAEFKYYDMHQIIGSALKAVEKEI